MSDAMDTTTFDDLIHQAEQLTAEIDGESELPRVERNLKQLLEAGQQLWSRTSSQVPRVTSDVRASVLLGSKGYDLQKVTQQLDSLSAAKKVIPVESIADTDIKGFLKNERENAIMNIIDDVRKTTIERADKFYWDNLQREWEQEKCKILNSLIGPGDDDTQFDISLSASARKSPQTESSISIPKPRLFFEQTLIDTRNLSSMNTAEAAYAKEVINYVDQTIHGAIRRNISNNLLKKVAKESIGEQLVIEMWEIVAALTNDAPLPIASEKLENKLEHRNSSKFQCAIIRESRKFLEKKYLQSIQGLVLGESRTVNQTPVIMYNLIKNYLNSKSPAWTHTSSDSAMGSQQLSSEDGSVEGHPLWSFIWHCLRAGSVDAAIEALQKSSLLGFANDFINILREYRQSEDRRLSPKSENQIRLQYKKSVRLSNDTYKRAVFSLLGCCGMKDPIGDIIEKVDDYLWLRLSQLQLFETEDSHDSSLLSSASSTVTSSDRLTLNKLQYEILEEYGETHFNAHEKPFTYFTALFLTCQWESAIEFLFRIDRYRSHAVHIAITLNEIGLLLLPSLHLNVPLLSKQNNDPSQIKRLNYSRLISIYTRKFESNCPSNAIYYFYLLRDIKSPKGESLFIASVSQLVRDTKQYDTLLGYLGDDGCRIHGVIDRFYDNVSMIIDQVATDCENSGFFEDAVKLYDLGSKHTKVLQLLTKMLSPLVPQKKASDSKRTRLEILALKIAERYSSMGHNASREVSGNFYMIVDLMTFFDYYHNQQFVDALDTIMKLNLLPFRNSDVEIKVNEFGQFAEEIRRNIPDLILATMNILYSQFKEIKTSTPKACEKFGIINDIGMREHNCSEIRQKARSLIMFSGMIPYSMPGDTNARLIQLEVLMN